ncbi:MAG TPA: GNAT family protein [Desulfosporosinus sp.]|nr:GNAT family protein [Desulfosporosinus sp.]
MNIFTPFPTLRTEHLILRQITMGDLDELFVLKSDERLLKCYSSKAKTYEETRRKLEELDDDIDKSKSITWGISLINENRLCGSICLWNICQEPSKVEIGYDLMVNWQGRGIMQEAMTAVVEYGFKDMKLQLIEAVTHPNNLKSINLLERNSFIKGANFRETDASTNKVLDWVTYSLR